MFCILGELSSVGLYMVEMSDERGDIKNLRLYPDEYGSTLLKHREVLILLTVQGE